MSGAVGSRPNLMRSGTAVASARANLETHSLSGNSSSQPRLDTASACRTVSLEDSAERADAEEKGEDIGGIYRVAHPTGPVYCAAAEGPLPDRAISGRHSPQILVDAPVAKINRRESRAGFLPPDRAHTLRKN